MPNAERLSGVLAPVVTPFRNDCSPDGARFVAHCQWLLAQGCRRLALFGTNSEANSLSVGGAHGTARGGVEAGLPGRDDARHRALRAAGHGAS
jgi:4-hydroxy-tetrahydrodipicolinate synthase